MQIKNISYSESVRKISISGEKWERLSIEAEVTEHEDETKAATELRQKVREFLSSEDDGKPYNVFDHITNEQPKPDAKESRIEMFIKEIQECDKISDKTLLGVEVGLLSYEGAANSDARIKSAYDFKMIQLQQNK